MTKSYVEIEVVGNCKLNTFTWRSLSGRAYQMSWLKNRFYKLSQLCHTIARPDNGDFMAI